EGDRASQVGTVLREDGDLVAVLDHERAERQLALGIVTATVRHDERRVRVRRGEDLAGRAVFNLVDRRLQGYLDRPFLLPLRTCGPEVNEDGGKPGDHRRGQEACEPPAEKRPA